MMILFFKGFITGLLCPFLSISIALLIANLHMSGRSHPVKSGVLGIITMNLVFALIAAFGLHLAMISLRADYRSFSIIGAIILFLFALKFYKTQAPIPSPEFLPPQTGYKSYLFCLIFTASFPMIIIQYAAIYAALGIHTQIPPLALNFLIVIGSFLGLLIWWGCYLGFLQKTKILSPNKLAETFSRLSALILVCFSLIGLIQIYFI